LVDLFVPKIKLREREQSSSALLAWSLHFSSKSLSARAEYFE
jgi:hypothetical protein